MTYLLLTLIRVSLQVSSDTVMGEGNIVLSVSHVSQKVKYSCTNDT